MRQWMVPPQYMCRKHLLGEHVEHHMFVGSLHKDLTGYLVNGLLEPYTLTERHDLVAEEMLTRGYNHRSPLPAHTLPAIDPGHIDRNASLQDLLDRCPDCAARYQSRR